MANNTIAHVTGLSFFKKDSSYLWEESVPGNQASNSWLVSLFVVRVVPGKFNHFPQHNSAETVSFSRRDESFFCRCYFEVRGSGFKCESKLQPFTLPGANQNQNLVRCKFTLGAHKRATIWWPLFVLRTAPGTMSWNQLATLSFSRTVKFPTV